jgi:cellulose synthase/poly-beta-1,6-N-acetylglucosamine synthase-like glycosyltransferase
MGTSNVALAGFDDVLIVLVLLGAVPFLVNAYQYLLIAFGPWRNHYGEVGPYYPRVAILIPAWNEGLVLADTVDRLMALDYPTDRLRLYVVDDASTDDTPAILAGKAERYPGAVIHLRREVGGQGKSHTLNHGLSVIMAEDWMEATLIMDADVAYRADSLRKMTRHLADESVGAVTAYIREGSLPLTSLTRFIAYEYVTAQAAGRRAQNVIGAVACLAGGAQLHSRANLEALGGRIDTTSLAEDAWTTFLTQIEGRKVIFEPNAIALAEEPHSIDGLWKQRMRWARGNAQITKAFKHLWFRPSPVHRLGSITFGLIWFSIYLLPFFMIVSSVSLVILFFTDLFVAQHVFRYLWITNALCFFFSTVLCLLIDRRTARRSWVQAFLFPGAISLVVILYTCLPITFHWLFHHLESLTHVQLSVDEREGIMLFAYVWVSACMLGAYGLRRLEMLGAKRLASWLVYIVGYGPILASISLNAYIKEFRKAEMAWDKTEKTGQVSVPT